MSSGELLVCERAGERDLGALLVLARAARSTHWNAEQWLAAVSGEARAVIVLCAYRAGADAPWRELRAECAVHLLPPEAEIHDLAVAPAQRRRGLGRTLLQATLSWARCQGVRSAHLEVRAGNQAALRLYEGVGFLPVGRRRGYYRDPAEDGLVLRRDLAAQRSEP